MKIETCIDSLVSYAMNRGLAEPVDHQVLTNRLLDILRKDDYEPSDEPQNEDLEEILGGILDYAAAKGLCEDNITARDIFDTRIMGAVTPMPREVVRTFKEKYAVSPEKATDWYYQFSCDTDYIRRYRIAKDMRWKYESQYGEMDITINLSKPEKDPRAIAAAKNAPQTAYPKCQLCRENEGYMGRVNHPARQNHRILPITINHEDWFFQYSPYVYYNEHCIVFNGKHVPMKIDRATFRKQLDFIRQFPHYFVGSNADLPIVGGSILSHDHFQGGRYTFAMEKAPVEQAVSFPGFADVEAGIVKWPMSVIRLRHTDPALLVEAASHILEVWRNYSDPAAGIAAHTGNTPHNTITPIARFREGAYEMDLALRNNITTEEHPMGVFHPHAELHHIKKENIGLIEVMGLAILPARLKTELEHLADFILSHKNVAEWSTIVTTLPPDQQEAISKHLDWAATFAHQCNLATVHHILQQQVGHVFLQVLAHAGVFKDTEEGKVHFKRFIQTL